MNYRSIDMKVIQKVFTSLEQVYDRLGDVPCVLTITDDGIYGETIHVEAIGTPRREKRINDLFGENNESNIGN